MGLRHELLTSVMATCDPSERLSWLRIAMEERPDDVFWQMPEKVLGARLLPASRQDVERFQREHMSWFRDASADAMAHGFEPVEVDVGLSPPQMRAVAGVRRRLYIRGEAPVDY